MNTSFLTIIRMIEEFNDLNKFDNDNKKSPTPVNSGGEQMSMEQIKNTPGVTINIK